MHAHTLGHYPKIDATVTGAIPLLICVAELQLAHLSALIHLNHQKASFSSY